LDFIYTAHSHWRWIVLAILLLTVCRLLAGRLGSGRWRPLDGRLILLARLSLYVQVLMGLVLYVSAAGWTDLRFTAEHPLLALASVAVVESASARARRAETDATKRPAGPDPHVLIPRRPATRDRASTASGDVAG
jgi:hypothetical protein